MKSLSLVVFTLSAQAAVGAYLVLYTAGLFSLPALGALFLLFAAGLGFSLLHLGSPMRAYRALLNLGESWLSREIFFALLFAALLGANLLSLLLHAGVPPWLAWLTCLGGLLLVYAMSRAYVLPGLPSWQPAAVLLAFTSAALLLGGLLALLLHSAAAGLPRPSAAAVLALLAPWLLLSLLLPLRSSPPAASNHLPHGDLHQPARPEPRLRRLHLALLPLGFAAAALTLLPAAAALQTALLGLALGLVSAGEAANRLRFYKEGLGRRG
jgi:DMSO reductase anchor subunit